MSLGFTISLDFLFSLRALFYGWHVLYTIIACTAKLYLFFAAMYDKQTEQNEQI